MSEVLIKPLSRRGAELSRFLRIGHIIYWDDPLWVAPLLGDLKKVFTNAWYYHHRLTGRTANLHEMLGQVRGRSGDSSVAAANLP